MRRLVRRLSPVGRFSRLLWRAYRLWDREDCVDLSAAFAYHTLQSLFPIRAAIEPPVDPPQVVARLVGAMLGEIQRSPRAHGAVLPVHEPVHHGAGEQRQVGDARQQRGIEEGSGSSRHGQSPEAGLGTAPSRRSMS